MKHIFIANPTAGSGKYMSELKEKLANINDVSWELYETKASKDATDYIISYCNTHKEPVRFYACGGDGTLKEVANGVAMFPFAEMSCYPCGSGNDFVKCFGGTQPFMDLSRLVHTEARPIDLIKVNDVYSINVVNFGFDACVASTMIDVKSRKILGGRNAYITGIIRALFKAMKNRADIFVDGEKISKDKFLLCTVANGQYVGGSFKCAPRSALDDGMLDICLVDCVSRFKLIRLIKYYAKGLHLDNPRFEKFITYRRSSSVHVSAPEGFIVSIDGEIYRYNDFTCKIVHNAVKFAAPTVNAVNSFSSAKEEIELK